MGQTPFRASIVVPNYNGEEDLRRLLPTLASQDCHDFEVLIVDDCSPERSAVDFAKSFCRDHENMRLIENERNLGFTKTCNRGIGLSGGRYVCLLNNDTTVANNFVSRCADILDGDGSIGVLSSVIVDPAGKIWFSGGAFQRGSMRNLTDDFIGMRQVDWVAGTACFYRSELFSMIGALDEAFIMYHEDIDFCMRMKRRTNFRACMFSDRLVTHYALPSSDDLRDLKLNRLSYWLRRNHIILMKRYAPKYIPASLFYGLREACLLAGSACASLLRLDKGGYDKRAGSARAIMSATFAGLIATSSIGKRHENTAG